MLRRTSSPPADILDAHDAAALLRICEKTVLKLARDGEIPATRVGRQWRFSRAALCQYVASGGALAREAKQ
jgi:excisionase family DNA binding protein